MRKGIGIRYHHIRLVTVMHHHVKSILCQYRATTRLVQNTIVPTDKNNNYYLYL